MGKTKKVGIIARTLTCLMATAAIALSTASPAFAASEVTDSVDTSNISVTGRCERPLRASSASGERVALAASETVPAGTVLEFSILVMNPKDAETVREWLDYGRLRGLFQWRNSGKGRFEWEEVA